jgi:hypothetical protein
MADRSGSKISVYENSARVGLDSVRSKMVAHDLSFSASASVSALGWIEVGIREENTLDFRTPKPGRVREPMLVILGSTPRAKHTRSFPTKQPIPGRIEYGVAGIRAWRAEQVRGQSREEKSWHRRIVRGSVVLTAVFVTTTLVWGPQTERAVRWQGNWSTLTLNPLRASRPAREYEESMSVERTRPLLVADLDATIRAPLQRTFPWCTLVPWQPTLRVNSVWTKR